MLAETKHIYDEAMNLHIENSRSAQARGDQAALDRIHTAITTLILHMNRRGYILSTRRDLTPGFVFRPMQPGPFGYRLSADGTFVRPVAR